MKTPELSVIIPTLDEADHLPGLLSGLAAQQGIVLDLVVADGGSRDATPAVAAAAGVRLLITERGRGRQMNAAARLAAGRRLLFLHADSLLDDTGLLRRAVDTLEQSIAAAGHDRVAGHFSLHFLRSDGRHRLAYRYVEEKTAFSRPGTVNGDQGLLLTREYFERLGGFDESLPFFEDQRIAGKIRSGGVLVTLPGRVQTSARRFEAEGFHRRYILMSMMMGLHHAGEDDFLQRAPGVYRAQGEAGLLQLTPFFSLIRAMMRDEWGWCRSAAVFCRIGSYIRQNSWQAFYFLDVLARPLLGPGRYPFLAIHDRLFAPLPPFRLLDAAAGLFCLIWYLGILAPWYRVADYHLTRTGKGRKL